MITHTTNNVNNCGRNDMTDKLTSFKRILQTYTHTYRHTHTTTIIAVLTRRVETNVEENATTAKQVEQHIEKKYLYRSILYCFQQ